MKFENLADVVLLILFIMPIVALIAFGLVCGNLNEATVHSSCIVPILEPVYNLLNGFLLLFAFGGFIFYIPVVGISYIFSSFCKIKSLTKSEFAMIKDNRLIFNNKSGFIIWITANILCAYGGVSLLLTY